MAFSDQLAARLAADSTISGLVGSRIYVNRLPQKATLPALVWTQISGPRIHNLGGAAGLARPRYQIDSYGAVTADARSLAAAVRASLDGFVGKLGTIRATMKLDDERDLPETDPDRARVQQDYRVNHSE